MNPNLTNIRDQQKTVIKALKYENGEQVRKRGY